MATPTTKQEIESAAVHLLAETGESMTIKEIADTIRVKAPLVTRAVYEAKRATPQMIDIDPESGGSRYIFIGDKDFLDPLPESIDIGVKIPARDGGKDTPKAETKAGNQEVEGESGLSDTEKAILTFFKGKKKEAASAIYEELEHKASIEQINDALRQLEGGGYLKRQNVEDFDEDVIGLTSKGREAIPSEAPKADSKPSQSKAQAKAEPKKKPAKAKAKGPGRPAGDRDFGELRKAIIGYVESNPGQTKTDVGKVLSSELENFGRMSIAKEFVKMVEEGQLVPFKNEDGEILTGRYQVATQGAKKAEASSKRQAKPEPKPSARAEQSAEAKKPEVPESGGYAPKAKEAPVDQSSFSDEEVARLKRDLAGVESLSNEDLSGNIGTLFNRVLAYVEHLEQSKKNLREILNKTLDRV